MIVDAVANQSSFNIIHIESSFKIDFFVLRNSPYHQEEFSRRVLKRVDPGVDLAVDVQAPEDTVLSKLHWYRQGGAVSDTQWRDAVGILKAKGTQLDRADMQKWTNELGDFDLLTEATQEAEAVVGPAERRDV